MGTSPNKQRHAISCGSGGRNLWKTSLLRDVELSESITLYAMKVGVYVDCYNVYYAALRSRHLGLALVLI